MSAEIASALPMVWARLKDIGALTKQRLKRQLIAQDQEGGCVPIAQEFESFDLDTSFLEQ